VTVKLSRRTRVATAVVGAASFALIVSGCSSNSSGDNGNSASSGSDNQVALTVTTFGTMGFDALYKQYQSEHPNITIKANNIDTGDNAKTDWQTKTAAGAGLPDVQAIEEGWLGTVLQVSDQFTDLNDYGAKDIADRWVDWKEKAVTTKDGHLIGYGTDIGPEALCYNSKLFAAAGLPSDRDGVKKLFGDNPTWADYFKVGKQYHDATGKAFYDQSGFVWNAMVNQQKEGYYTKDGKLNIKGNEQLSSLWGQLAQASADGLSANQTAFDWGKGEAFVDGSFATMVCPGWMLGVVKGQVEQAGGNAGTGWDVADVFPGGASNWGGSWLTVPTQSKHPKEAAALAAWLTAPEQQVKAFQAAGAFPSTTKAQTDPGVTGPSDLTKFFNDAPVGQILASRAEGVVPQFKGPDDSVIQSQVFGPAIQAMDAGKSNGTQAWKDAMSLLDQLVVNK
jgi:cellobiose transport system substrate-binding protein